jgi:LruC domain-containing protein
VPNYLTPIGESVGQDALDIISANLPEGQSVPDNHPEYIANSTQANIALTQDAEVWVYFISEGSRKNNALGYYTYPSNNPPQNAGDTGPLTIIYPNMSFPSSGGNLHTGDKVYLGTFPAGTTVAWFMVPDGWAPSIPGVKDGSNPVRYSNADLNTFTDPANHAHSVMLLNPPRELLLLGFEESNRPGGDHDFNDAVMGVKVSPFSALDQNNLVQITSQGEDGDGDGIPDYFDRDPVDPAYAFESYSPTETGMGTLAFEDFWPAKGDYDLNDMVVDYHVTERLNAANQIVQIFIDLRLRAMGASFRNGLGFDLNVPAGKISDVSGSILTENYITLGSNGAETGQSRAVVIAFDNGYSLLYAPGGGFVNTQKDQTNVGQYDFQLNIVFTEPIDRQNLGLPPYNPFLIAHGDRGVEVHLPRYQPTDLANLSLFGTQDDDTNLSGGKTYMTSRNLPWALRFPVSFPYPIEKIPVNIAYLRFNQWAESGGGLYPDWFQNNPGYLLPDKIY